MALPRHVVFSRKGFDSATGCVASPILDDGTMVSLPIPDPDNEGPVAYGDLSFSGYSYGKLITDLRARRKTRNKETGRKETTCLSAADRPHLDPDLIRELRPRPPGWRPAYGQRGSAMTILQNQKVSVGDLFIFFGWFRHCQLIGGTYRSRKPDLQVVFGYLRIGKVHRLFSGPAPEWARDHHAQLYGTDRMRDPSNTLFEADDHLGLPGAEDLPGAAAFTKFVDTLQLTAPGRTKRWWRLPKWFYPFCPNREVTPLSSHGDRQRWELQSDSCLLESAAPGQEFVLDVEQYPEAIEWVADLIRQGIG